MTFFLIGLVILLKQTISHSKSHSNSKSFDYHPLLVEKNLEETPSQQQEDHEKISLSLSRNETDIESESTMINGEKMQILRMRYSFIDIDPLVVNVDYLNQEYVPPTQLDIDIPSPDAHPYSNILDIKGNTSVVIYNRFSYCHEFTMHSLLQNVSYLHSYTYVSSELNYQSFYDNSSLVAIARSIIHQPHHGLLYERQMHFFDFYALQFPSHPVWINLVQEPIHRVAAEYQRSRELCRNRTDCRLPNETINETLDECVAKRSAKVCISAVYGVGRMLPYFCGLNRHVECKEESSSALEQAKQNIVFYYTVVGFVKEFYKFLYVLEKLLPKYFKLARLIFMNQQDPQLLADPRDLNITLPNERTTHALMPLLKYEYQLYEFIQERFLDQYRILVELDN